MSRFLTPKAVAALLQIKVDTVLGWIHRGHIIAIDVSSGRGRRPRWRISEEAFQDFLTARTASPPPPAAARRRRQKTENVIEFF